VCGWGAMSVSVLHVDRLQLL